MIGFFFKINDHSYTTIPKANAINFKRKQLVLSGYMLPAFPAFTFQSPQVFPTYILDGTNPITGIPRPTPTIQPAHPISSYRRSFRDKIDRK